MAHDKMIICEKAKKDETSKWELVTLTKIVVWEVSECVRAHSWWKYDAFVRGTGFGSLIISADAIILTTASSFLENNDGTDTTRIRQ